MSKLSINSTTVAIALIAFAAAVLLMPVTAEAGWKSHYDEYPGDDSPDWGKIIAIGVAGGLAIGLIAYLAKDKKDDASEADSDQRTEDTGTKSESDVNDQSGEQSDSGDSAELKQQWSTTNSSWNVGLYVDAEPMPGNQLGQSIDLSDEMTVGLGVSLSF